MNVYDAIKEMRRLSDAGKGFCFSFMSFSADKQRSKGIVEVRNAKLMPRSRKDKGSVHEFIERYWDLDVNEARQFYHPLLLSFNSEQLTMNS